MRTPQVIRILTLALALVYLVPRSAPAGLIMRIDTENKLFFMEGSDTGQAFPEPPPEEGVGGFYLQFQHTFVTNPSENAVITETPQNLFVQETTLPISSGGMNLGQDVSGFLFISLYALTDITALTGKGPSTTVTYASLQPVDRTLFESMIGQTIPLVAGSGYSPISVQAVPEPSTYAMALAGLACGGYSIFRRHKRA
jgi:hypothetical protein